MDKSEAGSFEARTRGKNPASPRSPRGHARLASQAIPSQLL